MIETTPTTETLALASYVALRVTDADLEPGRPCIAWIESRERTCGKGGALLCPRHVNVARRRRQAAQAKDAEQRARRAQRERQRLPQMRQELAELEAWLNRHRHLLEPSITDRAATGGAVHAGVARRVEADWQRGLKIYPQWKTKTARAESLRHRIVLAEQ